MFFVLLLLIYLIYLWFPSQRYHQVVFLPRDSYARLRTVYTTDCTDTLAAIYITQFALLFPLEQMMHKYFSQLSIQAMSSK